MKIGERILLSNRYGDKNYLVVTQLDPLTTRLEFGQECYYRAIAAGEEDYFDEAPVGSTYLYAVDPSGGPFISIGSSPLKDFVVDKIIQNPDGISIIYKEGSCLPQTAKINSTSMD